MKARFYRKTAILYGTMFCLMAVFLGSARFKNQSPEEKTSATNETNQLLHLERSSSRQMAGDLARLRHT